MAGFHRSPLSFLFVFSGSSHKFIKAQHFQSTDITGFITSLYPSLYAFLNTDKLSLAQSSTNQTLRSNLVKHRSSHALFLVKLSNTDHTGQAPIKLLNTNQLFDKTRSSVDQARSNLPSFDQARPISIRSP